MATANKYLRKVRLVKARSKGTHTSKEWITLKSEFSNHCVRFGRGDMNVEKDHIIPIYQGGSDSIKNIQPVCAPCNSSKGPENFNWVEHRRKNSLD